MLTARRRRLIAFSLALLPAWAAAGVAERPEARRPEAAAGSPPASIPAPGSVPLDAPLAPAVPEAAAPAPLSSVVPGAAGAEGARVEPRVDVSPRERSRPDRQVQGAEPAEEPGLSAALAWSERFDGTVRRPARAAQPPAGPSATAAHRLVRGRSLPAAALALAAVNGAVYAATSAAPPEAARSFILVADRFQQALASASLPALAHEALTLVTASFIHANFEHLAYNLLYLLFFGAVAERVWGARRLVTAYLLGAVLGALVAVPLSHTSGSGASGAICAVAGALIAPYFAMLKSWRDLGIVWGPALIGAGAAALVLVAYSAALWLIAGPLQGQVGVSTHAAAGLAGAALGAWWTLRARRQR